MQTEAAVFALLGRCSGVTGVISARRQTSAAAVPYHLDTPLSFVSRRPCIWYAGHGRREANKRSTDSKRGATGDNYPTHNRPFCRAGDSLDSRKSRNSFPGIEKKDRDSGVSLTSLVQPKLNIIQNFGHSFYTTQVG